MGLFKSVAGTLVVELTSADIPGTLGALTQQGIPVFDLNPEGDLTVTLRIARKDFKTAAALCRKRGDTVRIRRRGGIYWAGKALLKRPVLVAGVGLLVAASLYVPSRVLFVRVEGNTSVPENQILEAAGESGIFFGAYRREVRSERVKNALLEKVPQLQWTGVNTYGCVAVITVRERSTPEKAQQENSVGNVISASDGVIISATATKGTLLCQPGQAVVEGQVLISGYTDCGICIQATQAEGEVYAQTRRQLTVYSPGEGVLRGKEEHVDSRWGLLIGKKRINLWKGSGISGSSCGRMYEEYYITLPGGFQLPVALVRETEVSYETERMELSSGEVQAGMEAFAEQHLTQQMIAGSITSRQYLLMQEGDCWRLEGVFLCSEMIGRQKAEQIGELHE